MKHSKKLGKRAFHLQYGLIVVFVLVLLASYVLEFDVNLGAWKIVLFACSALLTTVWGGIATKNFVRRKYNRDDVEPGGN